MGPKWVKNRFFLKVFWKILPILFPVSILKQKVLWFSNYLCKPYVWENCGSQVTGQNSFFQSDWKILWSSMSLEGIYQALDFWHGHRHYRNITTDYHFWLDVARCPHWRPNMLGLARAFLIGLGVWPD